MNKYRCNKRFFIRYTLAVLVASLLINGLHILQQWNVMHGNGAMAELGIDMMLLMAQLLSVFIFVIALIAIVPGETKALGIMICLACVICFFSGLFCLKIGQTVRRQGFEALAKRSASLVKAIGRYEADHHQPPETLEALVPDYLSEIPGTGIAVYPIYKYRTGFNPVDYDQNRWCLMVFTGDLDFGHFIYLPNQNYPTYGYGGKVERIRDWAYVHE